MGKLHDTTMLPPSPHGRLSLEVTCSTGGGSSAVHPITLERDWSLTTPHDLASERVLAALGGTLSCLRLEDVVVPIVRDAMGPVTRQRPAALSRSGAGRWRLTRGTCPSCRAYTFTSPATAARHLRSVRHWEHRAGDESASLRLLLGAVLGAHAEAEPESRLRHHPLVLEPSGMAELWDAGISPAFVEAVHAAVWDEGPALPVRCYVGAAYLSPDLGGLADVVRARPDPDVLTWAIWNTTPIDQQHPRVRLQWLELGVTTSHIDHLMQSGYQPQDALAYATSSQLTPARAGAVLAQWGVTGCAPAPAELAVIDLITGGSGRVPSGRAIDQLMSNVRDSHPSPTRSQAGVVLAAAGTLTAARRLLSWGVRDAFAAARHLDHAFHTDT